MTTTVRRATLLYDGDCGFCTRRAKAFDQWCNRRRRVSTCPWQGTDLRSMGLTADQLADAAWFVDGGRRLRGARAIAGALAAADPWVRPAGWIIDAAPVRPLAAKVYAWVADHRHRLPGATPACSADKSVA